MSFDNKKVGVLLELHPLVFASLEKMVQICKQVDSVKAKDMTVDGLIQALIMKELNHFSTMMSKLMIDEIGFTEFMKMMIKEKKKFGDFF